MNQRILSFFLAFIFSCFLKDLQAVPQSSEAASHQQSQAGGAAASPQLKLKVEDEVAITAAASPQSKSQVEVEAEITAADYCEFLNAVATTDPQNLYDEKMATDLARACVMRASVPGNFSYQVIEGKQNEAITFLSHEDAAHYCNWLSNKAAKDSASTSTFNFNSAVDLQLRSNQITFNLSTLSAISNSTAASSAAGWWSSLNWEEKTLAAVGAIGVVGFAWQATGLRCCPDGAHEAPQGENISETNLREIHNDAVQEVAVPTANQNELIDAITGKVVFEENLLPDQRSSFKKFIDGLRGRDHVNTMVPGADDLDYIEGLDPKPEERSCMQKIIYSLTRPFYKDGAGLHQFLKDQITTHAAEKEALQNQIDAHAAMIDGHGEIVAGHLETIAQKDEELAALKEAFTEQANPQERDARLACFETENRKITSIEKLLAQCASLEELCLAGPVSEGAEKASVHSASSHETSSSAAIETENKSAIFQQLRALVYYATIKQQHFLERKTKGYLFAEQAEVVAGQIQTQLGEAIEAHNQLAEFLETLRKAKYNLWKYRGQQRDDFTDHQNIPQQLTKINKQLEEIKNSAPIFIQKITTCFAAVHHLYEQSESANSLRFQQDETKARTAVGSGVTQTTLKKTLGFHLPKIFRSSPSKKAGGSSFAEESKEEAGCNAITERIRVLFVSSINPETNKVEHCFSQAYQLLHLAEKNAIQGEHFLRLYEADTGKVTWEMVPLRAYLVGTLEQSRGLLYDPSGIMGVQDFFTEIKGEVCQFAAFTDERQIEVQAGKIKIRVKAESMEAKLEQASVLYAHAQAIEQSLSGVRQKANDADVLERSNSSRSSSSAVSTTSSSALEEFYAAIRAINEQAQGFIDQVKAASTGTVGKK